MESTALAKVQGAYYAVTGIWPLLHMRSFLAVTGPKIDLWLVETVGALVTCIGGQLLMSASSNAEASRMKPLAAASAASLAAVEIIHVAKKRISPIYLLDAAAEIGIALLWLGTNGRTARNRRARQQSPGKLPGWLVSVHSRRTP